MSDPMFEERQGDISMAMDAIEHKLNHAEDLVDHLQNKLTPILTPARPADTAKTACPDRQDQSLLGHSLGSYGIRLTKVVERLEEIRDRCQL